MSLDNSKAPSWSSEPSTSSEVLLSGRSDYSAKDGVKKALTSLLDQINHWDEDFENGGEQTLYNTIPGQYEPCIFTDSGAERGLWATWYMNLKAVTREEARAQQVAIIQQLKDEPVNIAYLVDEPDVMVGFEGYTLVSMAYMLWYKRVRFNNEFSYTTVMCMISDQIGCKLGKM